MPMQPIYGAMDDLQILDLLDYTLSVVRANTVELLLLLNEVERRGLYGPEGCRSMFEYCRDVHHMSEDVAYHRLRTARAARRWPEILPMIEDGRLTVTGVSLLSKHLRPDNAEELIATSVHQPLKAIRRMLAERFPSADVPTSLVPLGATPANPPVSIRVGTIGSTESAESMEPLPTAEPPAPQRFALTVTIDQEAHDLLRYAQSLVGPDVAPGDVSEVLKRALAAYAEKLERTKLGAGTGRSRASDDPRYVPVAVRREVWERDGGQCTFVGADGHRCECRDGLQFDHVKPVGKGGDGNAASNVRLLCDTHNRLEADRAYGAGFMQAKVEAARASAGGHDERESASMAPSLRAARTEDQDEARINAALRHARATGRSPGEVLNSGRAAAMAMAELDRLFSKAG